MLYHLYHYIDSVKHRKVSTICTRIQLNPAQAMIMNGHQVQQIKKNLIAPCKQDKTIMHIEL